MAGKLKAAGLLAAMFVLGAVAGAAWQMHMFHDGRSHWEHAEHRISRLQKQLHLTSWQEQQVKDIMQDAHDRARDVHDAVELDMTQIHADSVEAINQVLTPEQRVQFEKIHQQHHRHEPDDHEPGAG